LKKPREVEHDSQVFRAYLREAERLAERGARIDRVVLDYELKRDFSLDRPNVFSRRMRVARVARRIQLRLGARNLPRRLRRVLPC
jgi:hypothetical protein